MPIYIVHLTDIHIKSATDKILDRGVALAQTCCSFIREPAEIVFCITGDLSYSGNAEQLSLFKKFLDDVISHIENKLVGSKCHVFTVPGNHDCNFSNASGVRSSLLKNIDYRNTSGFDKDCIKMISSEVQKEYLEFSAANNYGLTPEDYLCCTSYLTVSDIKLKVVTYNTSWMSVINESAGSLCMPINLLPDVTTGESDLVISMIHHPIDWLHPDNAIGFDSILRNTTDLVLCGHEHISDPVTQLGQNWNYQLLEGKELQANSSSDDNSFAVYAIDSSLSGIQIATFQWHNDKFIVTSDRHQTFERNQANQSRSFCPNQETMQYLHDLGAILHHPYIDDVRLDDVFVWPDMEHVSDEDSQSSLVIPGDDVYSRVTQNQISLVHGDDSQGKTSLAKQIYVGSIKDGKCCLLSSGAYFKARKREGIKHELDSIFCDHYNQAQISHFHSLGRENRLIIIDDFEQIAYNHEKTGLFLDVLQEEFASIILLTETDSTISALLTKSETNHISSYRIRQFSRSKKSELIEKWYSLGKDRSALSQQEYETIIDNSTRIVDSFLGNFSAIMPATPLYILSILQTIDTTGTTVLNGHSYAYERIAKYSLDKLSAGSSIMQNVYISILSFMAYQMLETKRTYVSSNELVEQINAYARDALIDVDIVNIISRLRDSKILVCVADNKYKFKYPYLYYYFCGYYISKNINSEKIKEKIEHMSSRLHVVEYGNIMIFVCHFIHSDTVLESILLNAMCLFDSTKPFDFSSVHELLNEALSDINSDIKSVSIGEETDVSQARKNDRALRESNPRERIDHAATADSIEDEDEESIHIGSIISAVRIIEILGQILKNYPGEISGKVKIEAINEIKNLTMRIVGITYDGLGNVKNSLISEMVKDIRDKHPNIPDTILETDVRKMFHRIVFSVAYSMVIRASLSVASPMLQPALQSMVDNNPSDIAISLIRCNSELMSKNSPDYEYVIGLSKKLKHNNHLYAREILRALVANHLRHHHCGERTRDRLCSEFDLRREQTLIVQQIAQLPKNTKEP